MSLICPDNAPGKLKPVRILTSDLWRFKPRDWVCLTIQNRKESHFSARKILSSPTIVDLLEGGSRNAHAWMVQGRKQWSDRDIESWKEKS